MSEHGALLSEYRALLGKYRALLGEYKALLQVIPFSFELGDEKSAHYSVVNIGLF